MAKRLRALNGINYPADAESLDIMLRAGGFSKLTYEQREKMKKTMRMTRREAGDWCDDMPKKARARYLSSGDVEEIEVAAKPKTGIK